MFTHADVWRGIDRLAKHHGLTASGLARRAGLDPTTFNPSKRITKQAKPRWPSTESLAKILGATDTSFASFVALMADGSIEAVQPAPRHLRCLALDLAGHEGLFDEAGFPVGEAWDEIDFPGLDDRHAYALEVRGAELEPVYRDGDLLIVSPTASVRRRDRIVLKHRTDGIRVGSLSRRTAHRAELRPLSGDGPEEAFAIKEVAWIARIVWASQ